MDSFFHHEILFRGMKVASLLRDLAGTWEGSNTRVDTSGRVLDSHSMRIRINVDGVEWNQHNTYTWPDGRSLEFPLIGRFVSPTEVHFANSRIRGRLWVSQDIVLVNWSYIEQSSTNLWELMSFPEPERRVRVWQHTRGGKLEAVTFIDEQRLK